ncbi:hypothetical protein PUN28_011891 [Cardiocondyla obscurior]|uniref:Uncharacterized protein n=1 Tax=Cardiocondyla obscurior TaxID=286306 RepID=A0AAW2FFV6_9HYME
MSLNMNLKKKVISEFTEISKQSKEIETQMLFLNLKKNATQSQEEAGLPLVGYTNKARNKIHLGYNVYILKSFYDTVVVILKSIPQFVKEPYLYYNIILFCFSYTQTLFDNST